MALLPPLPNTPMPDPNPNQLPPQALAQLAQMMQGQQMDPGAQLAQEATDSTPEDTPDSFDPDQLLQLMSKLGLDPAAPEEDIVNILSQVLSGQGISPGQAGPDLSGAAARKLGGNLPMPPVSTGGPSDAA